MSSEKNIKDYSFREGTRVILREITANLLHNSSNSATGIHNSVHKNKDSGTPTKISEHGINVRFNREFEDVESCNSSAVYGTPETHIGPTSIIYNYDESYVDHDIPDVDDLIEACANIHLNQDDSIFQSCQSEESDTPRALNLTQNINSPEIVDQDNLENVPTCEDLGENTILVDKSTDLAEKKCFSLLPYVSAEENIFSKIKLQTTEFEENSSEEFEVIEKRNSNECPLLEEINPSNLSINKTLDYLDISGDSNEGFSEPLSNTIIVKETPMNLLPPVPQEEEKEESTVPEEIHSTSLEQNIDELYEGFQPERQSTSLAEYENELELAAQEIADRINKSSLEDINLDENHFVPATSQFFGDPKHLDSLLTRSHSDNTTCDLRKNSIYVQFDPLLRTSMLPVLPQAYSERILNEQQNEKSEITSSANANVNVNINTPLRHGPALAAIDNLLYFSPLPRTETEKIPPIKEQTEPETNSSTIMIDENRIKELKLVKSALLEMTEEVEKHKQENEVKDKEIERQKLRIEQLEAQLTTEIKCKNEMSVVVDEYERSMSRLMSEREKDRLNYDQEKNKLQEELQATNHHLTNTESAFNDVHMKYERLKGVVSVYKSNETVLKDSITENCATIKKLESRYEQLKNHAMSQLEKANLELDGIKKSNDAEKVKLQAMLKKSELKQNSLSQENEELTRILDDVLARLGNKNPQCNCKIQEFHH